MSDVDPAVWDLAEDFVAARFPRANTVVLAGSTASGTATPTSDIDLLLLGPPEMFPNGRDSLAATYDWGGRLVEVFAYTPASYRAWAEREASSHRPVILTMLLDGAVMQRGSDYVEICDWAQQVAESGPTVTRRDLDMQRYTLSALLDDLTDTDDRAEEAVVLADAFQSLATFLLLAYGRWLGSGKWLVRRLREWDPDVADRMGAALVTGDRHGFVAVAHDLLAPHGGPLQAGMVR